MAVHGTTARFYYHTLDFSDYVEEVDPSFERDLAEYAPLSASWKSSLPGLRTFTIALSGLYDSTANKINDVAWATFDGSTNRVFSYLPLGNTLGYPAYSGESTISDNKVTAGDDVVRCPVTVLGTTIANRALIGHVLSVETASGNEVSIDSGLGAAENFGLEAYLICTAFTGTSLDVIIEDSDDDGVGDAWTTVVAFTQLAAVGSERKSVAASAGVLKRYVRVSWTIVGASPSMTFFVAWYRKTS